MKRRSTELGPQTVYESVTEFSLKLYRKVCENQAEDRSNVFLSPYSVSGALMLTMLGTAGTTEEELRKGLFLDTLPVQDVHGEFKHLNRTVTANTRSRVEMHIANRIFCEKGLKIRNEYAEKVQEIYGSKSQGMDFMNDPEGCRNEINEWTAQQTNRKMKDLIPVGQVSQSTMMVLTNAIYFKGDWAKKFKSSRTKSSHFYVSSFKKVRVDMMRMKKETWKSGHSRTYECKVLQLPYEGNCMSMLMFLPDKVDGIKQLERDFSPDFLSKMKKKLERQDTIVEIPKFRIESSFKLEGILPELGIKALFTDSADLSAMFADPAPSVGVTQVFHKAFVEVNEEGTEAAAATAVEMDRGSPPPVLEFIADHPFLFAIIENKHWTVLFIGRLSHPESNS